MCECGCGDFHSNKSLRLGNHVLAIEIYPGCEDCGAGLISTLHVFTPEEAERWDLEPEEFKPDKYGHAQIDIPLLDQSDLIAGVRKIWEEDGVDFDDYGNLEDFLKDYGLRMLQEALFIRLAKKPGEV